MAFFASRANGREEPPGAIGELAGIPDQRPNRSTPPGPEATGLPPWVESAVKKLLASVLPQFKPLVDKTEAVLADAQITLAGVRADARETQADLKSLRLAQIETMTQLVAMKASVDRLALVLDADSTGYPMAAGFAKPHGPRR